jgi:chromosome transmission fidelity protein 4
MVTGTKDFHVSVWSLPDCKFEKLLTRTTSAITDVAFRPDGTFVAIAAEDGSLVVANVADASGAARWSAHDGAVESIAYAPDGNTLVSCGTDGTVRLWNLEDNTLIWKRAILPKQAPTSWHKRRVLFHPNGETIAVPNGGSVLLVDAASGAEQGAFVKGHTGPVTSIAWCPNGAYLATASQDCQLLVWDCKSRESTDRYESDVPLVEIAWQANQLALLTEDGQLALWRDVIGADMPSPTDNISKPKALTTAAKLAALFDVEGEKTAGAAAAATEADEDAALLAAVDAVEAAMERAVEANKPATKKRLVRKFGGDGGADDDASVLAAASGAAAASGSGAVASAPRTQAAFMPNASPADRKRRFLAWNMVGLVLLRDDGTHAFVEIEFNDQSQNRNAHFTDHNGVSMAALNERATVFGSRADAVNHVAAAVHYRPHGGAASGGGAWTVRMPMGVDVLAVALGTSFVAAATSENALRLFSATGVQTTMLALPGAPVAIVGAGSRLAVVSAPADGAGRALWFDLLDVAQQSAVVKREPLPLSSGAALTWLGMTADNAAPLTYDADGVLRVRDFAFGGQWVPILVAKDACKSSETLWPVSCQADALLGVVTPDRDAPGCVPRPTLSLFPLAPPFAHADNANTALERTILLGSQQLARWDNAARDEQAAPADVARARLALDASLLKLFTAACKSDKIERATELAQRLRFEKSLAIAARMAGSTRHHALAEQVGQLIYARRSEAAAAAVSALAHDTPAANVVVMRKAGDDAAVDVDDAVVEEDDDDNNNSEEDSAELSAAALRERQLKRKAMSSVAADDENVGNTKQAAAKVATVAPVVAAVAASAVTTDAESFEATLFRDKKRGNPFAKKAAVAASSSAAAPTAGAEKKRKTNKVMQSLSKLK